MTRSARIGLAATLLLGGVTFALARNGPATGPYPPAAKNPDPSTSDLATRQITVERLTTSSAILFRTTATWVGAAGDNQSSRAKPGVPL